MTPLSPLQKKFFAGIAGYLAGFLAQITSYFSGLREGGGGWDDYDGTMIAMIVMNSVATGLLGLQAFLAKSPSEEEPKLAPPEKPL